LVRYFHLKNKELPDLTTFKKNDSIVRPQSHSLFETQTSMSEEWGCAHRMGGCFSDQQENEKRECTMAIKILLADDHKIVRDGLRALLEKSDDLEVVGEASNGQIALELTHELVPDVVVMDIGMPVMNGIEATEQIIKNQPDTKVIGLSMHSDRRFVSSMLGAGATGYLLKDCAFDELVNAIHAVFLGQIYIGPGIAA
jgi:CheY-like chemotaxis protein